MPKFNKEKYTRLTIDLTKDEAVKLKTHLDRDNHYQFKAQFARDAIFEKIDRDGKVKVLPPRPSH